MSWLVYRLTDSALWLGIINFVGWFSAFLIMPWAGVILDCGSRRKILVYAQLLGSFQAAVLAYLTLSDQITVGSLLALSMILGAVNGFDMPGRHSFVSDLVPDRQLLGNAIALNSSMFNLARLIGPALAGILVAKAGEGVCFLINSISFLPFAVSLRFMNVEESQGTAQNKTWLQGIYEGILYALKHEVIWPVLIMLAIASLMGMSIHIVLMPVVADKLLAGGSDTLGYLTASMGLGAVIGALWLASRPSVEGLVSVVPIAFGSYGFCAIMLSQSTNFAVSLLFTCLMGLSLVNGWSSSNTLLQSVSRKEKRGRVMSLYLMCFTGMSPVGCLLMGWLSSAVGIQKAMILGGTVCIVCASWFASFMRNKTITLEI
ncbi:MAG: MFS transporter [Candidatus Rifleibacteriota bacterium]